MDIKVILKLFTKYEKRKLFREMYFLQWLLDTQDVDYSSTEFITSTNSGKNGA